MFLPVQRFSGFKLVHEVQAGVKIARGNINNLRYADDNTLTAESKGELEPLDEGERGG